MELPINRELEVLLDYQSDLCLSFYRRLESQPPKSYRANVARIRGMIREARRRLQESQHKLSRPIRDILLPAEEIFERQPHLWQLGNRTIVVFICEEFTKYFCLPEELAETTVQARSFYWRPLYELLG